jgi:aminoglycoside phosphotransferase (APT) family kinase protein
MMLPGLDPSHITSWLTEQLPDTSPPFDFRFISGGRSNLTFLAVDSAGVRLVLRRPPLGHVLESAHDVAREYRIISALASTTIPVPTPRAFCADLSIIGAPFYVMDFVDGTIVRDRPDVIRDIPEALRPVVGDAVIDVLARLHTLEPDAAGLGELGRRDGYIERQLRRWHRQWEAAKTREIPAVEQVLALLGAGVPDQQRVSIVHGDYRIDNLVLAADGSVAAVLDWELCTLGDPLADVGMLMVYWLAAGEDIRHMLTGTPTTAPGFPTRESLLARYTAQTDTDLSQISFYIAFSLWKLACIAEGMYARYRGGAMGEESEARMQRLGEQVPLLAERALAELEGDQTEGRTR